MWTTQTRVSSCLPLISPGWFTWYRTRDRLPTFTSLFLLQSLIWSDAFGVCGIICFSWTKIQPLTKCFKFTNSSSNGSSHEKWARGVRIHTHLKIQWHHHQVWSLFRYCTHFRKATICKLQSTHVILLVSYDLPDLLVNFIQSLWPAPSSAQGNMLFVFRKQQFELKLFLSLTNRFLLKLKSYKSE